MFHPVLEVSLRPTIYHYMERATFSFSYDRDDAIGCKSRAIFAPHLSCYEVVRKTRYLSRLTKMFSAAEMSGGYRGHVIVVTGS